MTERWLGIVVDSSLTVISVVWSRGEDGKIVYEKESRGADDDVALADAYGIDRTKPAAYPKLCRLEIEGQG